MHRIQIEKFQILIDIYKNNYLLRYCAHFISTRLYVELIASPANKVRYTELSVTVGSCVFNPCLVMIKLLSSVKVRFNERLEYLGTVLCNEAN